MKIIYSPFFEGHQYVALDANSVLMETCILSTQGLIEWLELHLGLHTTMPTAIEREIRYHELLKAYISKHPDCILAESFDLASLSVTKTCLKWRDELALYGWDANVPAPTQRLQVLQAVEQEFAKSDVCLASRVATIKEALSKQPTVLAGSTIQLMIPRPWLPPYIQSILELLSNVEITETSVKEPAHILDKVEIWQFANEHQAYQYIVTMEEKYDVWINRDNKLLDNWLHMSGGTTTGSTVESDTDPIQTLLLLTARIMDRPLQLKSLVDYLMLPVHPLDWKLRRTLAEKAAEKGGYYNDECRAEKETYLSNIEAADKQAKERKKIVAFLPIETPSSDPNIPIWEVKERFGALQNWAAKRAHYEGTKEQVNEQLVSQLMLQCEQISYLLQLVENHQESYCTIEDLEQWIKGLMAKNSSLQYLPLAGCQEVIKSSADVVDAPKKLLWLHPEQQDTRKLSLTWLTTIERQALAKVMKLWSVDAERQAYNAALLNALRATEKITLVITDKYQGAKAVASSLVLRLKALYDKTDGKKKRPLVECKDLSGLTKTEVEAIDNRIQDNYIQLEATDKIQLRDKESASALDNIINHPLDYVMKYVAKIAPQASTQAAEISKIKGTTAHAILEELLMPFEEWKKKVTDTALYEQIVEKNILAYGAPLLQADMQLELKQMKRELRRCVENLKELLESNNLRVVACESNLNDTIGLKSIDGEDITITSYIDCLLEDADGKPIVFDFKWTSSKSYYQSLLKENKSLQLAIYEAIVNKHTDKKVERVGYFLMPEGRLYSTSAFKGKNCEDIKPDNMDDLLEKIKNSYRFRCQEILAGKIETAEATDSNEFAYADQTESKNLVPLKIERKKGKKINMFSDFGFLLSKK